VIALAPPDELRRDATNGDLLDIETARSFDASELIETEGVRQVSQLGPRHFRVVVDDAGGAVPVVVDRIQAGGVEVDSAREHRLSFDEIFAILVARHREAQGDAVEGDVGERDGEDWPDHDDHGDRRDGARHDRPEAAA
jgi:hypothetical protein